MSITNSTVRVKGNGQDIGSISLARCRERGHVHQVSSHNWPAFLRVRVWYLYISTYCYRYFQRPLCLGDDVRHTVKKNPNFSIWKSRSEMMLYLTSCQNLQQWEWNVLLKSSGLSRPWGDGCTIDKEKMEGLTWRQWSCDGPLGVLERKSFG